LAVPSRFTLARNRAAGFTDGETEDFTDEIDAIGRAAAAFAHENDTGRKVPPPRTGRMVRTSITNASGVGVVALGHGRDLQIEQCPFFGGRRPHCEVVH
jgi:hypothetical protein